MTFDRNEYLNVKESAGLVGKSESTIKRFVRENKGISKYFKYEKLPTGHRKIYISKEFLKMSFNDQDQGSKAKSDTLNTDAENPNNQAFVDYLLAELKKKDEQLKEKDDRIQMLVDKQTEYVDKLLQIQDQAQKLQAMSSPRRLEEDTTKKKRWWQRS